MGRSLVFANLGSAGLRSKASAPSRDVTRRVAHGAPHAARPETKSCVCSNSSRVELFRSSNIGGRASSIDDLVVSRPRYDAAIVGSMTTARVGGPDARNARLRDGGPHATRLFAAELGHVTRSFERCSLEFSSALSVSPDGLWHRYLFLFRTSSAKLDMWSGSTRSAPCIPREWAWRQGERDNFSGWQVGSSTFAARGLHIREKSATCHRVGKKVVAMEEADNG